MPVDQEKSLEILKACGMWDHVAEDVAANYPLERIIEVADYVVNVMNYKRPPAAIVKALREQWTIPALDRKLVNDLLGEFRE